MPIATKICELVNKNERPDWWRYTLTTAIQKGELSQIELQKSYSIAKMEYGLEDKCSDYSDLVKQAQATGFHAEIEENKLLSIGNIQNTSSLAKEQKIEFSKTGMTVIYGNNGVGKSSYAKILKNACLTRGDAPKLRNNVFTTETGTPSAEIIIESNGKTESINWNSIQQHNQKLKSIRIFDSSSSTHYLSKSDPLDFKAPALSLLDELLKACQYIIDQIKTDERVFSETRVLPEMHIGTRPSKLVISASLLPSSIDTLVATDEELIEIVQLREEVIELTNNSPAKLKDSYKKRRLRLTPFRDFLTNLVTSLDTTSVDNLKTLFETKEKDRLAATTLSSSTFDNLPISGIGSANWLAMWKAVKIFIQTPEMENNFPPIEGDNCPTCLQDIDATSASRLKSFDEYLKSALQKEADKSLKIWKDELKKIQELNFSTTPYIAILDEIKEKDPELRGMFDTLITSLTKISEAFSVDQPIFEIDTIDMSSLKRLNTHIAKLEEAENSVLNNETKTAAIASKNSRILEIEDRKKIRESKPQILAEIEKAKKRNAFDKIKRSASTAPITKLNNEICNSGEIGKMQQFFDTELKKLGFKHFAINTLTKGSKGAQNFSIHLENNPTKLLEIASEGEQKCISLASFFAELAADSRRSAIVFDDPVNSLDHIWRQRFATRIVKESEVRQVIVLTHDLPFLKMIQESLPSVTITAITRSKDTTGIPLERPPWDSLKTKARIGLLKNNMVKAKKAHDDSFDDYQSQAGIIYGKMRETWERLIEEWLIRGVVERFNREVKTQSVKYLSDITDMDISIINSSMSKCSTYMNGHDMAEEFSGIFPAPSELAQDISDLEEYFVKLKARRS